MIYSCGHRGCDICGARECGTNTSLHLKNFSGYVACELCVTRAVKFAYNAAATFGGTIIDVGKPCGKLIRTKQ